MGMLQDWQVDVQSGVGANASTFLTVAGGDLKSFIGALDLDLVALKAQLESDYLALDLDALKADLDLRYLQEVTHETRKLTPDTVPGEGFGDGLSEGFFSPAGADIGIRLWPRPRKVFYTGGQYPSGQEVTLSTLDTLEPVLFRNSVAWDEDVLGSVTAATGLLVTATPAARFFTALCSVKLRPTNLAVLPGHQTVFQLVLELKNPGGAGTEIVVISQTWGESRSNFLELTAASSGAWCLSGTEIRAYVLERGLYVDGTTNTTAGRLEVWACSLTVYMEE